MPRREDARLHAFDAAIAGLVKLYQFRDREEPVAWGLSVSQAYALRALAEGGPLPVSALAAELRLSVSAATRLVDALASRGLVRRTASREDRRVRPVVLSARGRALWDELHGELLAIDREVLQDLSAAECDRLVDVLRRLTDAIEAWRADLRTRDRRAS